MYTVYSKPNCPQCVMTKKVLEQKGLDFSEVDVTQDTEAFNLMVEKGFRQMPVVEKEGDFFTGFRPDKLV